MLKGDLMQKNERLNNQAKQRGNAMVYVLIALALFGFLTITLSSQNDQADGQDLDDEQAVLYANELISYVASAQQAVDMMLATGSEIDDLDFVIPSDAAFDTPPHYNKVFHPQGGGLNYQKSFNSNIATAPNAGWFIQNLINVEWTTTTANDILLSALRINKTVCDSLNKKIGITTAPITLKGLNGYFQSNGLNNELNATECPDCDGRSTICIESSGGIYGLYSIIAAQ